ncbi:MAG: LapA family protein [Thermodesulfovibrionales bacterium]|nr:LapA family protein [Thermodesulfovibrionales bacterium]
MTTVIVLLILIFLVAIFSVQNAVPVSITFFFWRFEASLAIIVFLSAICGLIAGVIMAMLIRKKSKEQKEEKSQLHFPDAPTNL